VFTVRGTKKFLDRVGRSVVEPPASTTALGDWYANVLFWRPQVALFVNATTFLPVLMPLAPAGAVLARLPGAMSEVIHVLGIDPRFVVAEQEAMHDVTLAKTASRQVLGVMNEFAFMAEQSISTGKGDPFDLLDLSVWLASTIVGPLTVDVGYTPVGALQRLVATVRPG
jgi:hypothetical protein